MHGPRLSIIAPILILTFFTSISSASEKAMTSTGEVVILNDDGTWKYEEQASQKNKKIKTNPGKFKKPATAKFPVKSKINRSGLWLDANKWVFAKGEINPDAEYEFKHKRNEIYAMVINEAIEVNPESLIDLAFQQFSKVGSNVRVLTREYRVVNGQIVIFMETAATVNGIDATYLGYYYSDSQGSSQILTFTGTSLANKYKPEMLALLNGFIIQ